ARVHAPWALALEARLAERLGARVEVLWSDDGIVLRLPEAVDTIPTDELLIDPDEVEELVVRQLPATALFASRFREAAARALLLPRRRPGERTPLWQQRQRAADLLEVASRYPAFPILLESTRECLADVFDVPALRQVLTDLRSRRVRMVPVETRHASPFAQSLLFGWIAVYMYEGDAPLAERRAAALALDRDLLRELLGADELRELLDPEVVAEVELELQQLAPTSRRVRHTDDLHDLLRDLGDLSDVEIAARVDAALRDQALDSTATLIHGLRAIRIRILGERRVAGRRRGAARARRARRSDHEPARSRASRVHPRARRAARACRRLPRIDARRVVHQRRCRVDRRGRNRCHRWPGRVVFPRRGRSPRATRGHRSSPRPGS